MSIHCIGDIHGKFDELAAKLMELPEQAKLICVGDIGLGFEDARTPNCLRVVNGIARSRSQQLWMIRGNHDDPEIWRSQRNSWNLELSQITLVKDVDLMVIEGVPIIFVGGAISIDRIAEHRVHGETWWRDESVVANAAAQVKDLTDEHGPAKLFICHAGPITALPVFTPTEPNIAHYAASDAMLPEDIEIERTILSHCVQFSGATQVVYGHYHVPLENHNTGVNYRCVAELELWSYNVKPMLPPLRK